MTEVDAGEALARTAILDHPAVARVRAALTAVHVTTEIVVLDGSARTAALAADYLGVATAQIANSLVFEVTPHPAGAPGAPDARDGADAGSHPILVLTSGAHRVDTAKVGDLLELATVTMAGPERVRAATGFVIGGVAPLGSLTPLPTYVDVSLARHATVWAAAGHPRAVFATSYEELLRVTGAQAIETT